MRILQADPPKHAASEIDDLKRRVDVLEANRGILSRQVAELKDRLNAIDPRVKTPAAANPPDWDELRERHADYERELKQQALAKDSASKTGAPGSGQSR